MNEPGFVNDLARANETRQRIGAFFAGLAAIGGGVFLLAAPVEEIAAWSGRVPVGGVAILFGAVGGLVCLKRFLAGGGEGEDA